jgi:putative transposase
MLICRGYKTELDPNQAQIAALRRHVGAARHIYNWALDTRMAYYELDGQNLNQFSLNPMLTIYKQEPENTWLYEVSNSALQSAIRNMCRAYDNFFRRLKQGVSKRELGFPKFHSRYSGRQSFTLNGPQIRASERHVNLPKLGSIRLKEKGYIAYHDPGVRTDIVLGICWHYRDGVVVGAHPANQQCSLRSSPVHYLAAHISCEAGRWYVSVQVEEEVPTPLPSTGESIGVHTGARTLATCSNGLTYPNTQPLKRAQRKLARLEREKSRRVKGGANRAKTVGKIAALHARIANQRNYAVHNASAEIARRRPRAMAVEAYDLRDLMQQNRADHKHAVARLMSDAGAGELRRQLQYKSAWNGTEYIAVPEGFPSMRTCSVCGWVAGESPNGRFRCGKCGVTLEAELNAALNLKNFCENKGDSQTEGEIVIVAGKPPET